jgi:hypothetical protein
LFRQCGNLNSSQPYRLPRLVTRIALLLLILVIKNAYKFYERNFFNVNNYKHVVGTNHEVKYMSDKCKQTKYVLVEIPD